MNWETWFSETGVEVAGLAKHLDEMNHLERLDAVRTLPRAQFKPLFGAVEGALPIDLEHFVPANTPVHRPVRHHGVNTLPFFRFFEKPTYKSEDGCVGGRNVQFWSWLTGPGYFQMQSSGEHEVHFDYARLPDSHPTNWPAVRSNRSGFSFFVFRDLLDVVRRVSEHVVVGQAFRGKSDLGQYFILVRDPGTEALPGI
jgi:hypothetical protein